MIRKLRAGMMPPPGARRPERGGARRARRRRSRARIDRAAALNPNPGSRPFQRLNRAEYTRAVSDLLAVDVDVNAFLPPDTISHGFDNVADAQTLSPTLMEGYLRAASQISRLAVGDRNASATSATYKVPRAASQMRARRRRADRHARRHRRWCTCSRPTATTSSRSSLHYEPLGGLFGRSTMSAFELNEQIEVSIDGERVAVLDLNTRMSESDPKNSLEPQTPPVHVKAGPHRVSAAFVAEASTAPPTTW